MVLNIINLLKCTYVSNSLSPEGVGIVDYITLKGEYNYTIQISISVSSVQYPKSKGSDLIISKKEHIFVTKHEKVLLFGFS